MKMTLIGAGVRAPFILHGLADRERELGLTEIVLHDTDHERLELMAALGAHLCAGWGARFSVRGEPDARTALTGARFVFTAIRVGQERARALDEQLPLKYGALGQETTGAGGFAMAMRTIPVMLDYARLITEVAPNALIVNFTNPVGLIMQAVTQFTDARIVGVCDGPIEMKRSVAEFLNVPPDRVHADYMGLNHAGWIHRVLVDGRDRLPEIIDHYEDLQRQDPSWALFDPSLVRTLGMLPMEYLYFYYSRQRAVENILASGSSRGEQIAALNAGLWPALRRAVDAGDLQGAETVWERAMNARDETYFARERGESLPEAPDADEPAEPIEMFEGEGYEGLATAVMTAAVQRLRVPLILNVPNRGAMPDLQDDDVVEVTCLADEHGAHPLAQGRMPAAAKALIEPLKAYERLTVDAATSGSYDSALTALMAHPLIGGFDLARSILDDYLSSHAEYLGYMTR
jgi:6-phospho-beta-glucosidase